MLILVGMPLLLIAIKLSGLPIAAFFQEYLSLVSFPESLRENLRQMLFVPLAAIIVVLVRLTLGLRVLGPFRSILLAVAFQFTGVQLGLAFLFFTIAVVAGIRPLIKSLRLAYFGRISVILSSVAVLTTLAVMASHWLNLNALQTIAHFPIVVLCLIADAFARTIKAEGMRSAIWRVGVTAFVAVVLAALASVPMLADLLIQFPEILVIQIGVIVFVSRKMDWRLLKNWNPKVVKKRATAQSQPGEGLGLVNREKARAVN